MFEYVLTIPWGIIDNKKVVEYSLNSISEQLKHCIYCTGTPTKLYMYIHNYLLYSHPYKAQYVHTQLFTVQLPLQSSICTYTAICDDAGW